MENNNHNNNNNNNNMNQDSMKKNNMNQDSMKKNNMNQDSMKKNNMNKNSMKKGKGHYALWVLGVLTFLGAVSSATSKDYIAAIILLVAALILLPPVCQFIFVEKLRLARLKGGLKTAVVIILVIIGGALNANNAELVSGFGVNPAEYGNTTDGSAGFPEELDFEFIQADTIEG